MGSRSAHPRDIKSIHYSILFLQLLDEKESRDIFMHNFDAEKLGPGPRPIAPAWAGLEPGSGTPLKPPPKEEITGARIGVLIWISLWHKNSKHQVYTRSLGHC